MARVAPTEPHIVPTKGMGPGFAPVTIVLTIINIAIIYAVLYLPLNFFLPSESNPASDSAVGVDALFKFMTVFGAAITVYVTGYTAYFAIVPASEFPTGVAVTAPESCANLRVFRMRSRTRSGIRCRLGVST